MEKALAGLFISALGAAVVGIALFLGALLSTLGGAFAGWVVGMFWPHTMAILLAKLGLAGVQMWQLGAMLGFVGSFFRSSTSSSSSKD